MSAKWLNPLRDNLKERAGVHREDARKAIRRRLQDYHYLATGGVLEEDINGNLQIVGGRKWEQECEVTDAFGTTRYWLEPLMVPMQVVEECTAGGAFSIRTEYKEIPLRSVGGIPR